MSVKVLMWRGSEYNELAAANHNAIYTYNADDREAATHFIEGALMADKCTNDGKNRLAFRTIKNGELPSKASMVPVGAVESAMHMVDGLVSNDRFKEALELWNRHSGCDALFRELIPYAERAHQLYGEGTEKHDDAPGVFDYEVSFEFGQWVCESVLQDGKEPDTQEAFDMLQNLNDKFWDKDVQPAEEDPRDKEPLYRCPDCKSTDNLHVMITTDAQLIQLGQELMTDAQVSSHYWDDKHLMRCGCGQSGIVAEFKVEEPPSAEEIWKQALYILDSIFGGCDKFTQARIDNDDWKDYQKLQEMLHKVKA